MFSTETEYVILWHHLFLSHSNISISSFYFQATSGQNWATQVAMLQQSFKRSVKCYLGHMITMLVIKSAKALSLFSRPIYQYLRTGHTNSWHSFLTSKYLRENTNWPNAKINLESCAFQNSLAVNISWPIIDMDTWHGPRNVQDYCFEYGYAPLPECANLLKTWLPSHDNNMILRPNHGHHQHTP